MEPWPMKMRFACSRNTKSDRIFNGNNYSEEWVKEAAKRGLPNIKSSVEAYGAMANEDAVRLFEKYKVRSDLQRQQLFRGVGEGGGETRTAQHQVLRGSLWSHGQ